MQLEKREKKKISELIEFNLIFYAHLRPVKKFTSKLFLVIQTSKLC